MTILEVNNLTKIYKDKKETKALDNISFSINKNEIVGLLGPNGAGKTTTIKCICNLILPNSGKIFIKGVDAVKNSSFALTNVSSVLEGNRNIYWRMTVKENLKFFAGLQGVNKKKSVPYIEELIDFFNLKEKINTQARFLSRGMQQKLAVGCAFVRDTEILLLDEPTLGLDVETTHEMRGLIKKKAKDEDKTILLSSHNMKLIEDVCEKVIIITKGRIVVMDDITNIKNLFAIKSFVFDIAGDLAETNKKEMEKKFNVSKCIANGYSTTIQIEMKETVEIYNIMDFFKSKNFDILRFETQQPDLEEIYLKIVKKDEIH